MISISAIICLVLLGIAIVGFLLKFLAGIKNITFDSVCKALFTKSVGIPLALAVVVFIFASILPYSAQMRDEYEVACAQANIELYQQYIKDYSDAAQKQIEDFQKAQSEMAKQANALQLQYYSNQIDVVGNKLTDQIKIFNDEILKQRLEINKYEARIKLRPTNKWTFGVK